MAKTRFILVLPILFFATSASGQSTDPSALCAEKFMPGSPQFSNCLNSKPSPPAQSSTAINTQRIHSAWGIETFEDKIDGKSAFAQLSSVSAEYFPLRREPEKKWRGLLCIAIKKNFLFIIQSKILLLQAIEHALSIKSMI